VDKKRKVALPSIWRDDGVVAKVLEVRHGSGTTMSVVCHSLPLQNDEQHISVILRKVKGTDLAPESQTVGKYTIGKLIAAGNYGKVKKAYYIDSGNEVAVKIINKKLMNEQEAVNAMKEIEILSKLHHPNIIQFLDLVDTDDRLYMFMECAKGGSTLKQYIAREPLSEAQSKNVFKQLASAMKYCHEENVIHRDIKPSNVLISGKEEVKVIDFGLSAVIESGNLRNTFCGSPSYTAPEILLGEKYFGKPVDVWSLGVLLYLMVANTLPFDCLQNSIACKWVLLDKVSEDCNNLLSKMIVLDPSRRASLPEILKHPWLQ